MHGARVRRIGPGKNRDAGSMKLKRPVKRVLQPKRRTARRGKDALNASRSTDVTNGARAGTPVSPVPPAVPVALSITLSVGITNAPAVFVWAPNDAGGGSLPKM